MHFFWNSSDDEDDTAELLAELQRIKKERAQEEARKVKIWLPFKTYCKLKLGMEKCFLAIFYF